MYLGGNQLERLPLLQGIQINVPKITQEQRREEQKAEAADAQEKADAKLEHFGKFPLGSAEFMKGFAIPTPKYSTHSLKGNVVTVNAKPPASAGDLRDFYAAALTKKYGWQAAGNCWEKSSPVNKKMNSLCLQASNNEAV